MPISTKVVSSNPVHGEVYSIQHYVIWFVSDLRQVGGLSHLLPFTWSGSRDITVSGSKLRYDFNQIMSFYTWNISTTKTGFVTRLTRRVSLVEQDLQTLPEHPSSSPAFSGIRVTRSSVLYVCFVDRCLSFCTFYFGHCVVCSSSVYGF